MEPRHGRDAHQEGVLLPPLLGWGVLVRLGGPRKAYSGLKGWLIFSKTDSRLDPRRYTEQSWQVIWASSLMQTRAFASQQGAGRVS